LPTGKRRMMKTFYRDCCFSCKKKTIHLHDGKKSVCVKCGLKTMTLSTERSRENGNARI